MCGQAKIGPTEAGRAAQRALGAFDTAEWVVGWELSKQNSARGLERQAFVTAAHSPPPSSGRGQSRRLAPRRPLRPCGRERGSGAAAPPAPPPPAQPLRYKAVREGRTRVITASRRRGEQTWAGSTSTPRRGGSGCPAASGTQPHPPAACTGPRQLPGSCHAPSSSRCASVSGVTDAPTTTSPRSPCCASREPLATARSAVRGER
jgi:hypothetical protein